MFLGIGLRLGGKLGVAFDGEPLSDSTGLRLFDSNGVRLVAQYA